MENKVVKQTIVTDVKVMITPPYIPWYAQNTMEERERWLRSWVKEFNDFLRDHRSQDANSLDIERNTQDICSGCKENWEIEYREDGKNYCTNCGREVEIPIVQPKGEMA